MRVLLYPEHRRISENEILGWGHDAAVNAAVDAHVKVHGVFTDDAAYDAFTAAIDAPDLDESIELLSDLGLATFRAEDVEYEHAFDDEAFERDREREAYGDDD